MGWGVDPQDPTQVKKGTVTALYPESEANKVSSPEQTSQAYMTGNVDLTDTDLTSDDGMAVSVSIYDALGYGYTVKFNLKQDEGVADKSLYTLTIDSILDSNDNNITKNGYTATIGGSSSIKIKFDPDNGSFSYVGSAGNDTSLLKITPNNGSSMADVFTSKVNGEQVDGVTIDFGNLTMYESDGNSTAKMVRGATDNTGGGRSMGSLDDVSIDKTGKLYGVYSNGETKLLGQIVVANFLNPTAMEALGDSLYTTTQNSGEFDGVGSSVDENGGSMSQGVLEMSNVDLSTEFTEMITTQRGFQANSRIITTSDSMLEELVNLKR
jgi:flagellar hook protein FlgE